MVSLPAAWRVVVSLLLVLLLALPSLPAHSQVVSNEAFTAANTSINDAFSSLYYAEQNGGEVSELVERLNGAIALVQRAQVENATDPNAAVGDLQKAIFVAQSVSQESVSAADNGMSQRQFQWYESLGAIFVTISSSGLVYFKGPRVYRRLWVFFYRKYLVKAVDE